MNTPNLHTKQNSRFEKKKLMTGPMDGGLGSCVLPALFFYSCGFNIIGGIIGFCYCSIYYAEALYKNDDTQKTNQLKNMGRWAVSAIPLFGPTIALLYMN